MHTASTQLSWLVLQLADSGFPAGGFAHSAGLEAAIKSGEVSQAAESLEWFCSQLINQAGFAALPFVNSAYAEPEKLQRLDELSDAFLTNHVANRASRIQGRAFLGACAHSFALPEIAALRQSARDAKLLLHFAPLFGALCKTLGIARDETRQLFLYLTVRGALSAAVRLNTIGPYAAQQLQVSMIPAMDHVLDSTANLSADDAAQTAPLLELFQMNHDRIYSRLFQS